MAESAGLSGALPQTIDMTALTVFRATNTSMCFVANCSDPGVELCDACHSQYCTWLSWRCSEHKTHMAVLQAQLHLDSAYNMQSTSPKPAVHVQLPKSCLRTCTLDPA